MVFLSRILCSSAARSAAILAGLGGSSASAAASSSSRRLTSASLGRRSAMRRPRLLRMVRKRLRRAGGPSVVKPARHLGRLQVLQLHLDQVGELQVVEEEVEELLLGQGEGELVLALAVGAALAAAPAAARGLRDLVADLVFLVAGQHVVAPACVAAERAGGLAQAPGAARHPPGAVGLGHLAAP